jgi:hypothetical protein
MLMPVSLEQIYSFSLLTSIVKKILVTFPNCLGFFLTRTDCMGAHRPRKSIHNDYWFVKGAK